MLADTFDTDWVIDELEFLIAAGALTKAVIDGQICYQRVRLMAMTQQQQDAARKLEACAVFFADLSRGTLQ